MGSNDIPPPHVPSHVVPVCNALLQFGGCLWTICYLLYTRSSFQTKSYGMPLFALALNLAWELVYCTYVAESPLERTVFTIWALIDLIMLYGVLKFAHHEWRHSPWVAKNVGAIFGVLLAVAVLAHWTFAKWWLEGEVGKREGKFYMGKMGPDTTELGFWSAAFCQAYLSAASLCQLVVRGHSGGVGWGIWAMRTFGSISGLYMNYGWAWWFWPEAHEYFVSHFALFLWVGGFVCDVVYAFVLWYVQRTEVVLEDGRKVADGASKKLNGEKSS